MLPPALYLIPVPMADGDPENTLPAHTVGTALQIRDFVVEELRTARRTLKRFSKEFPIGECSFNELNEHTDPQDVDLMLSPLREGRPIGVMSEAGCPAIADPGATLVAAAQREGFRVVPLVGPSSIFLSLMASGFNGQGFRFNGYLPVENSAKTRKLKDLEAESQRSGMTQIFIETPYRNDKFIRQMLDTLRPDTKLCIATDITSPDTEIIRTKTIAEWKKNMPEIGKRPTIFLIHRS